MHQHFRKGLVSHSYFDLEIVLNICGINEKFLTCRLLPLLHLTTSFSQHAYEEETVGARYFITRVLMFFMSSY